MQTTNIFMQYRMQQHLSQLQICAGICTVITLSRIENGVREYDSLLLETILERMGKTSHTFEWLLNQEDYVLYTLRERIKDTCIDTCTAPCDFQVANACLAQYEQIMPTDTVLHQQFVLYHKALLILTHTDDIHKKQKAMALLHQAIALTRPDWQTPATEYVLFSTIEIQIIYQLFLHEVYTEEMIRPLITFVKAFFDDKEQCHLLIPFYLVLAQRYNDFCEYHNLYRITRHAIALLRNGSNYLYLGQFYYYAVKATYEIEHRLPNWQDKQQELVELCHKTYDMAQLLEDETLATAIEDFCQEYLALPLYVPDEEVLAYVTL